MGSLSGLSISTTSVLVGATDTKGHGKSTHFSKTFLLFLLAFVPSLYLVSEVLAPYYSVVVSLLFGMCLSNVNSMHLRQALSFNPGYRPGKGSSAEIVQSQ